MPKKKAIKTEGPIGDKILAKTLDNGFVSDRFTTCASCGRILPKEDFKQFKGDKNEIPFCSTECYNKG